MHPTRKAVRYTNLTTVRANLISIAMEVNSLVSPVFTPASTNRFDNVPQPSNVYERSHYHHLSATGTGYQPYGYHSSYVHHKGGKRSIALTALTLLSFLFFLHILQNCIQEQTDMMNPQVVIMQARIRDALREAEAKKRIGEGAQEPEFYNTSLTGDKKYDGDQLYHYSRIPDWGHKDN